MKTNQSNKQNTQPKSTGKSRKPENKDDLDSRMNEEQDFKKDDVTHNKKETKAGHLHKK